MKTRKEGRIIRQYLNNLTRIIIPSSVSFNYPHHLCPLPRRQMLCQLPLIVFKRYDSCRVRQWERGLLRSWGKDRAKSSGLSRDPVFFTVASLIRARACVCVCVDVYASCTVGVPRSTNRLSMYAWVISNGMETEPGGNKGDGGTVSIISLGIARYGYYRVSPLRQISRGRGWNVAGISSGTKKRKKKNVLLSNDVKFCENNFIKQSRGGFRLSVILRQVHENLPASGILEWTKFLRPNSRDIEQSVPSVKYRSEN